MHGMLHRSPAVCKQKHSTLKTQKTHGTKRPVAVTNGAMPVEKHTAQHSNHLRHIHIGDVWRQLQVCWQQQHLAVTDEVEGCGGDGGLSYSYDLAWVVADGVSCIYDCC